MVGKLRVGLALLCLLAVGGLIVMGRFKPKPIRPVVAAHGASWQARNQDCRRCHAAVWAEWESSLHAQSWTSPNVQAAFQHFGHDRNCESCHAPEPVAALAAEAHVTLRSQDRESGVDCLSCHALPESDTVAAVRTVSASIQDGQRTPACRPVKTPLIAQSRHCAACHTAIFQDWQESRYRTEGKTCQTCHMPAVETRPGGRSHRCLGGHDDELVRSGVQMECRQEGAELVVAVTNHATGHNFPGERHNRVLLIQVLERDPQGEILLAEQRIIKDITPFSGESSAEEIRVDATFTARFPVVNPPCTAEVQLLYKRFAWHADRDALVVHQWQAALKPFAAQKE